MGCGGSKKSADVADPGDVTLQAGDAPEKKPPEKEPEPEVPAGPPPPTAEEIAATNAATRLQACTRGATSRKEVNAMGGKHAEPCKRYRVNVSAANFGDCICGWPKAAHSAAALDSKAATGKRRDSKELKARQIKKDIADCEKYVINMEAATFGDCICGRPKADHSDAALGTKSGLKRVDSGELRKKFVQKEMADCKVYRVNMESANFGECICGQPKAEHTDEALKASEATRKGESEEEVRARMTSKEKVDCMQYRIDMDPSAPFGQCLCGAPKEKHCAPAFKGVKDKLERVDSGDLRQKMAQREKTGCDSFRLDMSPSAQFGVCVCGQPKAAHSDAALASPRG